MYYLYPLNKLKICFQSKSHTDITKSKLIRKFFVSPVKFTKVHVRGFVNEPTNCLIRIANRTDPDQTASEEAVWSGSVLFV